MHRLRYWYGLYIALLSLMLAALSACNPIDSVVSPSSIPTAVVIPTPQAGKGNVTGRLLTNGDADKPYTGGNLYLGRMIKADRPDAPPFIAFSQTEDILQFARNDATGEFDFVNVAPGEYGLVLDLIATTQVIEEPNSRAFIIVKVVAGQTVDLGKVFVK